MKNRIFNLYKPSGITSYDVIRTLKKRINVRKLKIGHFGTLDPFACGVLLVATGSACRLNDIIHNQYSKTYYAIGKLGLSTDTGDMTGTVIDKDESTYLYEKISTFSKSFLNEQFNSQFQGDYLQAPHNYSAAKFEGKKLYEYAREGVSIKKEKKLRKIYSIDVVKYHFPYVHVRVTVSTGTYVRSLFEDFAKYLGTFGVLCGLIRESIGNINYQNSVKLKVLKNLNQDDSSIYELSKCPTELLPFQKFKIQDDISEKKYINGMSIVVKNKDRYNLNSDRIWVYDDKKNLLGLGETLSDQDTFSIKPNINFR